MKTMSVSKMKNSVLLALNCYSADSLPSLNSSYTWVKVFRIIPEFRRLL